jgi:N-acetylneuraminic acid mutarotase
VLVVGGYNDATFIDTAERYNPATNSWAPAGKLAGVRMSHAADLLPGGQLLVTGGYNAAVFLDTAERYDPATNTWSPISGMTQSRSGHTATILPNGQVLVAGGFNTSRGNTFVDGAERFDPASNRWTAVPSLAQGRFGHTATLLATGRVLVIGGRSGESSYLATTEEYDPASNRWTEGPKLARPRTDHTATALPNGQLMVIGGHQYGERVPVVERLDLATRTWIASR